MHLFANVRGVFLAVFGIFHENTCKQRSAGRSSPNWNGTKPTKGYLSCSKSGRDPFSIIQKQTCLQDYQYILIKQLYLYLIDSTQEAGIEVISILKGDFKDLPHVAHHAGAGLRVHTTVCHILHKFCRLLNPQHSDIMSIRRNLYVTARYKLVCVCMRVYACMSPKQKTEIHKHRSQYMN